MSPHKVFHIVCIRIIDLIFFTVLIIALNQCVVYVFYDGFHLKMRENAVTMLQIEIDGNALLKTGFKKQVFGLFSGKIGLLDKF